MLFTIRKSGTSVMLAALWLCTSGSLPAQTFTTLYKFGSGGIPVAGLVEGTDGNLYGTTYGYAGEENGMIYKITPSGTLTTLHKGGEFAAALIQGTDGNFYGTTLDGGSGGGTVFKITPSGTFTKLYSFDYTNGLSPSAALVQATNGDLYGTTEYGGAYATGGTTGGTLFKITPSGTLTTVYSFCAESGCTDGYFPYLAALVQDTNGNLYGTTASGGANGLGTVFSLSVGLGPFVKTQTTVGKVGAAVKILGTDLTGATSVSFNGMAAAFTVVSPSLIKTTVPTGATTGKVEVVTPSGTLSTYVPYRVRP
jgi:uncharacterized repeat protein (TIGR03803 family)